MKRASIAAIVLTACSANLFAAAYTKNVAIVIFEGVEVLDLAAPAEVFAMAGQYGANGRERAFSVYTVGSTRKSVASQGFLDVTPDFTVADAPPPDILVLPGGRADNAIADPALMAWMKAAGESAEHILTICYGSFIAGKLGLVDDQDITTWFGSVERLGSEFPTARAREGRRFTDNGKLITSAGVSAGLDASMHLVARTLGRYVADRTAEYMEYPWAPQSFTSSKYPQLNPRLDARGRQLQQAAIAQRGGDTATAEAIYRAVIAADGADADAWLSLGNMLLTSKRYAEAIPALGHATEGVARARAFYNLACAYALVGERDQAIDAVKQSLQAGFGMKAMFMSDPDLASLRDDSRFQQLVKTD